MTRRLVRLGLTHIVLASVLVLIAGTHAQAQGPGIQGGGTIDPDTVFVGVHYETAPLVDRLRFRPSADVGFGEDLTLVTINFEFLYRFPAGGSPWSVYAGAGPAINIYRFDFNGDHSETEGGFNVLFGLRHAQGLFFEFKVGAADSPDLKFGVGYTWH